MLWRLEAGTVWGGLEAEGEGLLRSARTPSREPGLAASAREE